MPTALTWGKAHNDEFVVFENGFNGASQEQLLEAARRLREPDAGFVEVFWRVFFDQEPGAEWHTASSNWFGIHPDPAKAGLPMWASNAVLTPLQAHAVIKEATARVAEWLADADPESGARQVRLWCRCAEPELQAWFLRPDLVTGSQPAVAHLFIATPFNAGYLDPGGRWATDRPATTGPGRSGELVGALSALTSLGGGAPIGDLLRAAGRVAAAAEAVFGPSTPTDDNEIFAAICAGLAGTGPTTRPPFKGTGLACRMSSGPASVLDVTASTERYTSPPDDHLELRSTSFDGQWAGGTYQGDHLRFRRGPQPGPYGH